MEGIQSRANFTTTRSEVPLPRGIKIGLFSVGRATPRVQVSGRMWRTIAYQRRSYDQGLTRMTTQKSLYRSTSSLVYRRFYENTLLNHVALREFDITLA